MSHIKCPKACLEDVIYTLPNSYCIHSWLLSCTFPFLGPVVSKVVYLMDAVLSLPHSGLEQGQEV